MSDKFLYVYEMFFYLFFILILCYGVFQDWFGDPEKTVWQRKFNLPISRTKEIIIVMTILTLLFIIGIILGVDFRYIR